MATTAASWSGLARKKLPMSLAMWTRCWESVDRESVDIGAPPAEESRCGSNAWVGSQFRDRTPPQAMYRAVGDGPPCRTKALRSVRVRFRRCFCKRRQRFQMRTDGPQCWVGLNITFESPRVEHLRNDVNVRDRYRLPKHVAAIAGRTPCFLLQSAESNGDPVPVPGVDRFLVTV